MTYKHTYIQTKLPLSSLVRARCARPITTVLDVVIKNSLPLHLDKQVNKKFRKFERKFRDCIKRNGDKIGTQTCYDIST